MCLSTYMYMLNAMSEQVPFWLTYSYSNKDSTTSYTIINEQNWQNIKLAQFIQDDKDLIILDENITVEATSNNLIKSKTNSLPAMLNSVTNDGDINYHLITFEYYDLNSYLLSVFNEINLS